MSKEDYSHLVGQPVEWYVPAYEGYYPERSGRGLVEMVIFDGEPNLMISGFSRYSGSHWNSGMILTPLSFDQLTDDQLLGWQERDPKGYLRAAYAWLKQEEAGAESGE